MKNMNYAEKMNLFNKIWRAELRGYLAAGMDETEINEMYALHREQFNSDWRHGIHNQPLDDYLFADGDETGEDQSPLLEKYPERFSSHQPKISEWSRYSWIEDLDTPELAIGIKSLPKETIELITRMVVDSMSRADLAREIGVSRAAVTKRINTIKKVLEKLHYAVNKTTSPMTTP